MKILHETKFHSLEIDENPMNFESFDTIRSWNCFLMKLTTNKMKFSDEISYVNWLVIELLLKRSNE